jgi:hypothetical protein
VLDRSGVLAVIGELITAAVSLHVAVNEETETGTATARPDEAAVSRRAHFMRAAEYWHRELRLDGITSHSEALRLIKDKAAQSRAGEWVVVLGGWSEEQTSRAVSQKASLDAVAPNNPVALDHSGRSKRSAMCRFCCKTILGGLTEQY